MDLAPTMPDCVASDEFAATQWARLVPLLRDMGILHPADQDALARLCCMHSDVQRLRKDIATCEDAKLATSMRRILTKVQDQVRQLECEFAMTPSSRTKVETVPTSMGADGMDEFQKFLQADRVEPDERPTAKYLRPPNTKYDFFKPRSVTT